MQKVLVICAVLCYTLRMKEKQIETLCAEGQRLANMIGYMEDRQGFAPKELMEEFNTVKRQLRELGVEREFYS